MSLSPSNNARILIVDDDTILASLYRIKLTQAGFAVDVAENGEAGLLKISQLRPDLVILDLMLGDMNGVEVLEMVRKNEVTRALPVIVFSSAYLGGLMEAATRAGANKCLSKAMCSPQQLLAEVQAILAPSPMQLQQQQRSGLAPSAARTWAPPPKSRLAAAPAAAPSPAAATAAAATPATSVLAREEDLQGNLRRELADDIRKRIEEIGRLLPKWLGSAHNPDAPYLPAIYRGIRSIAAGADLIGCGRLAQMAGALEALLKKVKSSPATLTASVSRTISQTVEMLPALAEAPESAHDVARSLEPLILVVDREPASFEAIADALENARLRAFIVGDAATAARLLEWNCFDLVVVGLAGTDRAGVDFVAQLRADRMNRKTPLVALCDTPELDERVRTAAGEPSEFIAQPFLPMELALKALMSLERGRPDAEG